MSDFANALNRAIIEPIFNQEGVLIWRELPQGELHSEDCDLPAPELRAALKTLGYHEFIYLLESTLPTPDRARYSFLGLNPLFSFDSYLVELGSVDSSVDESTEFESTVLESTVSESTVSESTVSESTVLESTVLESTGFESTGFEHTVDNSTKDISRPSSGPPTAGLGNFQNTITLHQTAETDRLELESQDDPLTILQLLLDAQQRLANQLQPPPFPFSCGLIGYFGYELLHAIEALPIVKKNKITTVNYSRINDSRANYPVADPSIHNTAVPDLSLSFVTTVIVKDRLLNKIYGVALGLGMDILAARTDAETQLAELDRLWQKVVINSRSSDNPKAPTQQLTDASGPLNTPKELLPSVTKESYIKGIESIKHYLAVGDAYEVCLTQRFQISQEPAPLNQDDLIDLYLTLSETSPVPFAALIQTPNVTVVSASPERFLRLLPDRTVESSPIKGTRKRGESIYHDQQLKADLALNEKDRAEHLMIVDLVRNDLGKYCRFGTVEVSDLMRIETYSTVHQLISTIKGKLRAEYQFTDLFRALFPPGSMTGAPKVEAMRIIGELENQPRGVYSGALGYIDLFGGADLSVVIRTAVFEALTGSGSVHVGGAIVTDSDAEAEYAETLVKSLALERALTTVRRRQESFLGIVSEKTRFQAAERSQGEQLYESSKALTHDLSNVEPQEADRLIFRPKLLRPILLIDNYDSFTFNIYQYLSELGYPVLVIRNDKLKLNDLAKLRPTGVVISPGPGAPDEPEAVGICPAVIESLAGDVPILGVCLGLQLLVTEFGGAVIPAPEPRHGKLSEIHHNGHRMFDGVPRSFSVMRYHSLIAAEADLPECFQISARSKDDGLIMAIAHEELPITAVQFHPESIGSSYGKTILRNFCQQIS